MLLLEVWLGHLLLLATTVAAATVSQAHFSFTLRGHITFSRLPAGYLGSFADKIFAAPIPSASTGMTSQ